MIFLKLLIIICLIGHLKTEEDEFCYRKEDCENDLHLFGTNELNGMRYLIYDLTRGKSFSVRQNTYIQMARIVQNLGSNWTLVLPPWGLYVKEWKNEENELKNKIYWSDYFKVEILQELLPVIEFNEFLEHISNELDLVLILNRFNEDLFDRDTSSSQLTANRYELVDENCKHIQFYEKDAHIYGLFFGYKDHMKAKKLTCLKVNGNSKIVEDVLTNELKDTRSLIIQNVDLLKDDLEVDETYRLFRRSIQPTDKIIMRANKFRRKYFDSDDEKDKTFISNDLKLDNKLEKLNRQKQSDVAIGGNYISVHWLINQNNQLDDRIKNRDNLNDVNNEIDESNEKLSKDQIVKQILIGLKSTNLTFVFVATDGDDQQWTELNKEFKKQSNSELTDKYKLFRYKNKSNKLPSLELELIEQWICAHARLFIGTSNSMYSRLIQEQREILGFKSSSTFNVFCSSVTTGQSDLLCTE